VQFLSSDAFVVRIERRNDRVVAGRHIDVGLPGSDARPYSLYSGENDPWLEILVRRVQGGRVSTQLAVLRPGDFVSVAPPRGRFTLSGCHAGEKLLFLATGTGVAPFRSFVRSVPGLDYTLVHGVRDASEDFAAEFAPPERRVLCVSGPMAAGRFPGRLTAWLAETNLGEYHRVFLCGNAAMIVEAGLILADRSLEERTLTETYF
jgi:ferredoxin-NADP reductase